MNSLNSLYHKKWSSSWRLDVCYRDVYSSFFLRCKNRIFNRLSIALVLAGREDKLSWMLGWADICWLLSWFLSCILLAKFKMEKLNLHFLLPLPAILQATSTPTPPISCTYRYCVWTSSCCHWSLLSSALQWFFLFLLPAYAVPFQHIIREVRSSRRHEGFTRTFPHQWPYNFLQ